MKNENILLEKSFVFAIRIVKLYKHLTETKKEYVMSKQLLRCGTSIGANAEESVGAQSKADFIHKLSISYKEARETKYWLRLLEATEYLNKSEADSMILDTDQLLKIIGSIQISLKK
jgi:four helix bundle protein